MSIKSNIPFAVGIDFLSSVNFSSISQTNCEQRAKKNSKRQSNKKLIENFAADSDFLSSINF